MNTNKKLHFMIIVLAGLFIGQESLCAFSFGTFFKRYEKKKPADIIKDLENQLIDDPKNPQINYNLGVAQYQLNHFNDAKHNFERAALYGDKAAFKEQAYFNFATCLFKNTLSMLPQNWKNPDQEIDPNLLETAIGEISNAIKQYESVLLINEKNEKAISNKKEAEKLLRKLLEKKKQQDQNDSKDNKDDQDQKQDQEEQDKNKQNKDNQKNNKNDQQNKDQDQKSQNNQDSSGQDQKSQKQDKQEQKEQGKKDSKDSSENDDAQSQNNGQKDKPEQRGEKESASNQDEHKEPGSDRPEQKDGAEQEKKEVDHNEHNKKNNEQAESTPVQPTQVEDEKQENENTQSGSSTGLCNQEDSTEKRAYRAILDNLDTDESKLQKHLIMQKAKGQKPPVGSMQKPW